MTHYKGYEMVIGLEVHCELKTKTKIFCACPTAFGAKPNTQCCPICMGMPGTLPVLNKQVVDYAIKAGLATGCTIARYSKQDRKNYFYPDLPKAYQISQYDLPLCEKGALEIETEEGSKQVGITRIHIEEDAGKLVHDDKLGTLIDCNRCGVPLIEIVSEPDIRSADEAVAYFKKLRAIILATGISDCKMNEGSLRCDVNLSVRKVGASEFGTRTEMKNLNSFAFIQKAIEYEYKRQVDEIEAGGTITQETRRYDQASGKTFAMRSKENANDYRYFPDPDLLPIVTSEEKLQSLAAELPELPDARKARYMEKLGLSRYMAERLITDEGKSARFEEALADCRYPILLANLLSDLVEEEVSGLSAAALSKLADLTGDELISASTAKKLLRDRALTTTDPEVLVRARDLMQISDEKLLRPLVEQAIASSAKSVADYKAGKTSAAMAIVGKVMSLSHGKGNPRKISELVMAELGK